MKQKFIFLLAVLLVLTMFAGCAAAQRLDAAEDAVENRVDAAEDAVEQQIENTAAPNAPAPDTLAQTDAEAIALEHAGAAADQVKFLHSEYEIDDGVPQYDVEFYYNNTEYNYEIHAETGEILSFERDD